MAEATITPPRKRRRWLRALVWLLGVFIVLVVAVYFVATSSAFFTGVILPRVSKAINANITVSEASISPFKEVILRNLKVQTTGAEPLVTAAEVRARYNLMDIIGGHLNIEEVALSSPTVILVQNADGTSNLDPLLKSQKEEKPKEKAPTPAKPSKPPQLDLKKLALTDATIRNVKNYPGGNRDLTELSHVNVTLGDLKNGQTGKLQLAAEIKVEQNPPSPATNGLLQAKLNGDFALALTPDLKPASIQGKTRLDITGAQGAMADLAALGAELNCDVTPTEIKQVALHFQKGDARLGEVRVSGPFDLEKTEGRITVQILAIDKQVLNLAGAATGLDFGTTTINATNNIQLANAGSVITAAGQFAVGKLQLARAGQTTPVLDCRADYDVTFDRTANNLVLRQLALTGTQKGNPLLRAELTSPMTLALGNTANAVGDSTLNLTVSGLDLADWKPFLGEVGPAGKANLNVKLLAQKGGGELTFDLDSQLAGLAASLTNNQTVKATILLQAKGKAVPGEKVGTRQVTFEVNSQINDLNANLGGNQITKATVLLKAAGKATGLGSQQGGQQLTFDVNSQVKDLAASFGSNQINRASVALQAKGKAQDFKQFDLTEYRLEVAQQDQPLVTVSGSGTYDLASQTADLQVTLQAVLARLLQLAPQPDMSIASGTIELKARVTQKAVAAAAKNEPNTTAQTVTGNLALADLTAKVGKNEFRSFGTTMDLELAMTPQQLEIRKLIGKLTEGKETGGAFDLSGTYGLRSKAAQINARLTDLNQNGLRTFLEPMLGDKKLVSVALNATASAQYDPKSDSAVKADLQLANLVVSDPKQRFPATPLEAKMQIDASLRKQVADVRQFQLTLTPTARAKNELRLSGHLDLSDTNATTGQLKLAADSLDVTSYYDLFAGEKKTPEAKPAARPTAQTPPPPPAEPNKEPEPTTLPFRNFTAAVEIGRFYLREIEVANLLATARLDGGHVVLDPCKLALNGAPLATTLDLDLGVPGYKYALTLNAQALPLTPVINSFQPDRKDQIGGTLTANANISGTGTTGASLQKTLTGQFDISSTNLNLSVINVKSPLLKTLVNVVAAIPELLHNPLGAAASLIEGVTGLGGGGLMDELKRSPIDVIVARGSAGSGQVQLQEAVVQSPAFRADAAGSITLVEVLTNSPINIPITVSLSRPIAQRMGVAPSDTPANAAYAKLPDFLLMTGTLGKPAPDKKKLLVLGGAALKGIAGAIPALGGKAGGILQGVGNLLTGRESTATNSGAQTNQPAATDSIRNLLNPFFKPKK